MVNDVQRILSHGLTVADLSRRSKTSTDARVVFACDYGDYGRTQQALPVQSAERLGERTVEKTSYSASGLCLSSRIDGDDLDAGPDPVVEIAGLHTRASGRRVEVDLERLLPQRAMRLKGAHSLLAPQGARPRIQASCMRYP